MPGGGVIASAADRLDMILASITGDPRIAVEDLELRRGGVSYTIDTIKEIIERYRPEGKPALILGDDLTADFPKWKDADELARIADIIVARRMNTASASGEFPYPHRNLDNEIMNISSAMIRERIAEGKAWRYLVPRGARLTIEEKGLYSEKKKKTQPEDAITCELIARVEDAARAALSAKRFIHSRNTALMAADLAGRCGLDANAAYLAGIAHDMAKNQSSDLKHGKTAAVLLQKRFGIHNKDVLEAVEVHTTGKPRMGDLAKAVFIADKIEFSRPAAQSGLRDLAIGTPLEKGKKYSLDEIFYAVLEDNINWLKKTGIETADETLRLLEEK
jgi:nicotinate-nucleotide adenylyltransferase